MADHDLSMQHTVEMQHTQTMQHKQERAIRMSVSELGEIKQSLRELSSLTSQNALAINSLQGTVREVHERLQRLENAPSSMRAMLTGYGGCLSMVVMASLGVFSLLVAVLAIVISLAH